MFGRFGRERNREFGPDFGGREFGRGAERGPGGWEGGYGRGEREFRGREGGRGRERGFGGRRGPFGHGFGGGRERMFDGGDLQLVILNLLSEKPSYGYELIKTIEERFGGGYAPSPGVVYPTLTLLEERGLIEPQQAESSRKVYGVTQAGFDELMAQSERLKAVMGRFNAGPRGFGDDRSPKVRRALKDLHRAVLTRAVRGRVTGEGLTAEQMAKMVEAIEVATRTIDAL